MTNTEIASLIRLANATTPCRPAPTAFAGWIERQPVTAPGPTGLYACKPTEEDEMEAARR